MTLYIIGNGFDLFHCLPTRYTDFYHFLKKENPELLEKMESYFYFETKPNYEWYDFENDLGTFDAGLFLEAHNHVDSRHENFKTSDYFGLEDELNEVGPQLVEEIQENFKEWIESIDLSSSYQKAKLNENAIFLSFNYTSLLEEVYNLDTSKIIHLHGRSSTYDELIFGHGNDLPEIEEVDEDGEPTRTPLTDTEGASKYALSAFKKPVTKILADKLYGKITLSKVDHVYVVGHSLAKVDVPYFEFLAKNIPDSALWTFSYFSEDDVNRTLTLMTTLDISCSRVNLLDLKGRNEISLVDS